MNSFEVAKAASEKRRGHSCYNNDCPHDENGRCLIRIKLWEDQNKAAMAWNAHVEVTETVTVERGYL